MRCNFTGTGISGTLRFGLGLVPQAQPESRRCKNECDTPGDKHPSSSPTSDIDFSCGGGPHRRRHGLGVPGRSRDVLEDVLDPALGQRAEHFGPAGETELPILQLERLTLLEIRGSNLMLADAQ